MGFNWLPPPPPLPLSAAALFAMTEPFAGGSIPNDGNIVSSLLGKTII